MSNNRQRGDYFERQAREALRGRGWFVVRAGGSLGPADLVALRAGFVPLLIACKTNGHILPAERLAIRKAADRAGARALLAMRPGRGQVSLRLIYEGPESPEVDLLTTPNAGK